MKVPPFEELKEFTQGKPFFGKYLRDLRMEKKLSILTAARKGFLEPGFWSDLEHGRIYASKETLSKIGLSLEVSPVMLRLTQERLDHEYELWLAKYPGVATWLKALADKER